MSIKTKLFKISTLFCIGGLIYGALEILVKNGDTHISMFLTGGLCFVLIGALDKRMPVIIQMLAGAIIITALEFICGCIVNVWLGLGVWDYSHLPMNIMGQICVYFVGIWFFLSLAGIFLDDFIRWRIFGEEKPQYRVLRRELNEQVNSTASFVRRKRIRRQV